MSEQQARPLSADEIRVIERTNRTALEAEVIRSAGAARRWVLGGPTTWTKDELVRYVLHEVGEPMPPLGVSER